MITVKECTGLAQSVMSKYKYLYGAKGQPYTKELVEHLAKAYPGTYSAALKAEAMKDANKGYMAGDCSWFICYIMQLSMMGSTQLKENAVMKLKPQKSLAKEGMCLWKEGHVAYVGDDLKIYEMRSTAKDGTVSSWDKRAKDFTYMFVVKKSPLYYEEQENNPTSEYFPRYKGIGSSIVSGLAAVGAEDTSYAYRKRIAERNGIVNYGGTIAQNLQLVRLLKDGKLLKP